MIDAKNASFDSRWIAAGLFMGGLGMLWFTVAMNYNFAASVALTEQGKWLRAGSSIIMDCFGSLLMLAAGFAWASRQRWLAMVTLAIGICSMGYTGFNLMGFGANERVGAQYHRTETNKANDAAAQANREIRKEQASWMRSTAIEAKGDARKQLIEESNRQIDKAVIPVEVAKALPPDAQADMVHDMTGANRETVQRVDAIVFAALCILLKSAAFTLAPLFLSRKSAASDPKKGSTAKSDADTTLEQSMDGRTGGPLGNDAIALSDAKRLLLVEKFWSEVVTPSPGNRVQADDLHQAYLEWARRNHVMTMTSSAFGRVMTAMKLTRQNNGRRMTYVDVKLKPVELRTVATKAA